MLNRVLAHFKKPAFLYNFRGITTFDLDRPVEEGKKMYTIRKKIEISASHSLNLSYPSKCENLHGHNWIIYIWCRANELNEDGMVIDYAHIKEKVKSRLDHKNLNEVLPFNPTAENVAKWICDQIPQCYKVMVQESENNVAWYEED